MQGNEWAVGLGYGYHWILSRHWSLEAELGLGYSFADFDAYECRKCGDKLEERTTHLSCPPSCPCLLFMCLSKANREDEENQ